MILLKKEYSKIKDLVNFTVLGDYDFLYQKLNSSEAAIENHSTCTNKLFYKFG